MISLLFAALWQNAWGAGRVAQAADYIFVSPG
jgi:hypothetical protein